MILAFQHLYQWFYWATNAGAFIGGIACPLIELNYSYWAGVSFTHMHVFLGNHRLCYWYKFLCQTET